MREASYAKMDKSWRKFHVLVPIWVCQQFLLCPRYKEDDTKDPEQTEVELCKIAPKFCEMKFKIYYKGHNAGLSNLSDTAALLDSPLGDIGR